VYVPQLKEEILRAIRDMNIIVDKSCSHEELGIIEGIKGEAVLRYRWPLRLRTEVGALEREALRNKLSYKGVKGVHLEDKA